MQTRFTGRVWTFGEDISTDHIIAGRYLTSTDPKVLSEHAMENVDSQFAKRVTPGDVIVAGTNFGCGSSREQAPMALKAAGVSCVVANTFARIFFRNSINIGFPVVECPGLREKVQEGETVTVDLAAGHVLLASGERVRFQPLPPNLLEILNAGGLVPKLRAELAAKAP
ncbi:MAG TPA: 3-isopropylmalate dehydratase small subunit [Thermoplasmata archaeon]|nr:3-isopropylmalate dehydratase small subunit [Thermoplasmata archaeon]